jgi:hypothetical protein
MNEPNARITKIVAKMIQAIHGRPRQTLNKLTAEDADQAFTEAAEIDRNETRKRAIDARALDRMPADEMDLRKNYKAGGETDPAAVMAKIHDRPRRVLLHSPVEKGTALGGVIEKGVMPEAMQKAIVDKFAREK